MEPARAERKLRRGLRQANVRGPGRARRHRLAQPPSAASTRLTSTPSPPAPGSAGTSHPPLIGPTGIGKSWLGEAFAERACRSGYSAYCARASHLFHELHVGRGDGSYTRVLARLAKTDPLVIDDWGLAPLAPTERRNVT